MAQFTLSDGTVVTVNPCNNPRYPGCFYVSLPAAYDHTTFIIRESDMQLVSIEASGSDRDAFRVFLNAIAQS